MERLISRREFGRRLATAASGVVFLALQPGSSPWRSLTIAQSLRNDLTGLDGTLLLDDAARQAAATDFGRIVRRLPMAVLRTGSVQDVVRTLRFGSLHGVKVAMRGQGHSMLGQAQTDAGVVIDSSGLNSVRIINFRGRSAVEAGPGALWGAVLDAANASKLTPPVNVDPTYLSVGGTISTGGFGGTTWRHGFQVDHVLEVQVVTGDGQLVVCSDERNSDLFNAVLAGMGQCGIIVNVVMALVPAPTHVLFFVLTYDDLQTASADLTTLVIDGRFSHLDVRTAARPGGGFTFNVEAGAFYGEIPGVAQSARNGRHTGRSRDEPHALRAGARDGRNPDHDHRDTVFAGRLDSALRTGLGSVPTREGAFRPVQCVDTRTRNVPWLNPRVCASGSTGAVD